MAEEKNLQVAQQAQVNAEPSKEVALASVVQSNGLNAFGSKDGFELAQREAKMLANSSIVPAAFQGKTENCVIALEMAHRIGASPMMVMQNLYIVYGNPSFSSKFLIATLNACGKFTPLRYTMYDESGEEIVKPNPKQKPFSCVAHATEIATGEELYSPVIDMNIAKAEGWSTKQGSKWQTMPELMLRYRAAAFFQRTYAPEISMGILTTEEYEDMGEYATKKTRANGKFTGMRDKIAERMQEIEETEAQVIQENENPDNTPEDEQPQSQEQQSQTLFN